MCPILAEKLAKKIVIEKITNNGGEMAHKALRESVISTWLKRYTGNAEGDHLDRARLLACVAIFDLKDEKRIKRNDPCSNWKISANCLTN